MSFHDLHYGELPLLLPNAWDVPSALAFAEAGFAAIGTTSFGVASAAGRPDGSRSTRDANLTLARDLSRLPAYLSVDIEDGYSDEPEQVAGFTAVKRRCPDLFVNARVDNFWIGEDATVEAVLGRAAQYAAAGADGVFVPGVNSADVLRELAAGIGVPLNVLVVPALSLGDLAKLGVRRVSTGSLPYRAALLTATEVATAVRDGLPVPAAAPYPDLQARLVRYQQAGR